MPSGRSFNVRTERCMKDAFAKEIFLRLKWFTKNEQRLIEFSEKPNSRVVPAEILDKVKTDRQQRYLGVEKHLKGAEDPPPPLIDPNAIKNVMRPVDPAVTRLIYTGTHKDGRINYLRERYKTLPDKKFYFPETTYWDYGWDMWDASKNNKDVRYGRSQVVKKSFYRKNGVARDPDWYKEPSKLSPSTCDR